MDYTKGRNLFSYKGITAGKWWNNNGVLATASNKYFIFASAQIPIISNTPLTLQFWQPTVTATGSNRAWYGKLQYFDESKTYIESYRSTYFTTDHLIFTESPPDNAKYVAFSYQFERPLGDVNSTTVTVNTPTHRFKLEYGSEPTEWSPAPEDYDDYTGTVIPNILARNTITLAQAVDISAYYRFYKLQSSTAAPPAKPTTITTLPPDGWSDTEPAYTEGSTNSLYFVDLTVFSDNTFDYSNVSLSSSYEAAKQAYNKSIIAIDKVDNLEIGGRNLFPDTGTFSGWLSNNSSINFQDGVITASSISTKLWRCVNSPSIKFSEVAGKDVTLSFDIRSDDYETLPSAGYPAVHLYLKNVGPEANTYGNRIYGFLKPIDEVENDWTRFTLTIPSISLSSFSVKYSDDPLIDDPWLSLGIWFYQTESCQVRRIKFETGNKATDWTPAPEDSINTTIEYIVGTQTAATGNWTGVTKESTLRVGKMILYKLPYAGSGNASLKLTLADGTETENIPVYMNYSTSSNTSALARVTTHWPANSVIMLTYDGTYWKSPNYNTNVNNIDRRLHNNYIIAHTTITAGHIIAGTDDGYSQLAASLVFDLKYPILYASAKINAGTQNVSTYEALPSVNPSTTGTVEGLAKNKMVYLKGTLAGNTFTVAATNWLTCVIPTTEDGFYYIPLGMVANDATTKMYFSTSDKLYAYINGAFQRVDKGAAAIATATHQYFWHDTNGAHIGTVEGDGDSGYNSLWNSNGLMFRNSTNNLAAFTTSEIQFYDGTGNADSNIVARFGGNGVTLGQNSKNRAYLTDRSFQLIDNQNHTYLYVSDLRNSDGNANIASYFTGDGSNDTFTLDVPASSVDYSVYVNDTIVTSGITKQNNYVVFDTAPSENSKIRVEYVTRSYLAKGYTIGIRYNNSGIGVMSFAANFDTIASGYCSFAEGYHSTASNRISHAEGYTTTASGHSSHAEGYTTTASGDFSHSEGYTTTASGYSSHAEGHRTTASGKFSHAEGYTTTASENFSHAEGGNTIASGQYSHAEGSNTTASGKYSHAEGSDTTASGLYSHAEGSDTTASGQYSHASGRGTIANGTAQTVIGKFNIEASNYAFIIGNGTGDATNLRSNAFSVSWDGNVVAAGNVSAVNGTFSGAITGASYSGGAISGTTGTFTGAITGASYSGGAISGTTGTFTDAISGASLSTTGSISGGAISGTTVTTSSSITAGGTIYTYGKTADNDGVAGDTFGAGTVCLVRDGNPAIYFYRNKATSHTNYLAETANGVLQTQKAFKSGTTLTAGAVTSYTPTWGTDQTPVRYHCVVSAGICSFFFMGNGVAHSQGDTICTLPEGARPKSQVNVPFVKMSGNVVGVIQITTAGVVTVGFISSTTSTGRIYLNCTYPVV